MREQKMHEQTKKKEEKIKAGILIPVAAAVLFVYLGMAFYFHSHFFPGTVLDGLKTGGESFLSVEYCYERGKNGDHKRQRDFIGTGVGG